MVFVWTGVARALVGLGLKPTLERRMILIPFLLAIAFLGLSAGAESVARYRIPVMPLLAMIAAVGWFGRFKEAKRTAFLVRPSGDKKMAPSPGSARALGLSQLSSKTGPTQSIGE